MAKRTGSSQTCGSVPPSACSSSPGSCSCSCSSAASSSHHRTGVEGPAGRLLRDGLVHRGLEALEVDDEPGVADLADLAGVELDVVRLGAGLGQLGDGHRVAADPLAEELQRVEGGHHVEPAVGREAARLVAAGRARADQQDGGGGGEQATGRHHAINCAPYW